MKKSIAYRIDRTADVIYLGGVPYMKFFLRREKMEEGCETISVEIDFKPIELEGRFWLRKPIFTLEKSCNYIIINKIHA